MKLEYFIRSQVNDLGYPINKKIPEEKGSVIIFHFIPHIPIYILVLLGKVLPSSSNLRFVTISLQTFCMSLDFCSSSASDIILSVTPNSLYKLLTAWTTSFFGFIGTTYTKILSVANSL